MTIFAAVYGSAVNWAVSVQYSMTPVFPQSMQSFYYDDVINSKTNLNNQSRNLCKSYLMTLLPTDSRLFKKIFLTINL